MQGSKKSRKGRKPATRKPRAEAPGVISPARGEVPESPSPRPHHSKRAASGKRVYLTPEGLLEEEAAAAPAARVEEDSRTLAELAESVMAAANAAHESPEVPTEADEPALEEAQADAPSDEPDEPADTGRRRRRRAAVIVALFLLVVGLLGVGLDSGSGEDYSVPPGAAVALTPGGGEPGGGSGTPSHEAEPSPSAVTGSTPTATPVQEPAAGGEPTSAPSSSAASSPSPTPTPTPVPPAPTPTPTPTPGPTVHVGDLDGTPKGPRIHVRVYVHSSSHSPVTGASVSARWSGGYSGAVSCASTDVNGACLFRTEALAPGITVTLTVTGVTYSGASYHSSSNHDPDGDSNGTSISVKSN